MDSSINTLTSASLRIDISSLGAELKSIIDTSDQEYLWQAEPSFWSRRAPILFPIVGALKEGKYSYQGKEYQLSQHGFARDKKFSVLSCSDKQVTYRLTEDELTLKNYPFRFILDVCYRLEGNRLDIEYRVANPSTESLWFSIGGHPAFSLNWGVEHNISDYYLEFSDTEAVDAALIENKLLGKPSLSVFRAGRYIDLSDILFDSDALIFTKHLSRKVTLKNKYSTAALSVSFDDFPHLGIWSKPNAPFVCIEPWQGHLDTIDHNSELTEKAGIVCLPPNQHYQASYSIEINPA